MIRVMEIAVVEGVIEADEISLIKFDVDHVIEYVEEMFDVEVDPSDVVINERFDESITVTVSNIATNDGAFELMFVGKRQDYTGKLMS